MNQAHILSNCRVTGYKLTTLLIYLTSVSSWKYTYILLIYQSGYCAKKTWVLSPQCYHMHLICQWPDSCLRAQFKLKAFILIYCDYFGCQFSQPYINPSSIVVVFFTLNEYVILFAFLLENFFGKYDTQFTVLFGTLSLALNWLSATTTTTTTTPTPTQKPSYPW